MRLQMCDKIDKLTHPPGAGRPAQHGSLQAVQDLFQWEDSNMTPYVGAWQPVFSVRGVCVFYWLIWLMLQVTHGHTGL
jgi:hypothetical protein